MHVSHAFSLLHGKYMCPSACVFVCMCASAWVFARTRASACVFVCIFICLCVRVFVMGVTFGFLTVRHVRTTICVICHVARGHFGANTAETLGPVNMMTHDVSMWPPKCITGTPAPWIYTSSPPGPHQKNELINFRGHHGGFFFRDC